MSRWAAGAGGLLGIALALAGLRALSDATQSTHQRVRPNTTIELVVDARSRGAEQGQTLAELVEAQVLTCRLEVASDLVGPVQRVKEGRYRAVLSPSMDESNRRQFRGCLEDWIIDQVRLDVVRLTPS